MNRFLQEPHEYVGLIFHGLAISRWSSSYVLGRE
jgi:hypothetical protein